MTTEQILTTKTLNKLTYLWRGHRIQYTVMGVGQPLLLIHGFGASIGHWRKNIPRLAAQGYKVFALDLLGFGGSDKPALDYNLELWQEQVRDFWQSEIRKPTVLVGNSIGGLLTLLLMADNPDLTAAGVIINCAGGLNHRPGDLNLPLRLVMGTFTKLVTSPLTGPFIFDRIREKKRIRKTLFQVYQDRNAVTDELVEMLYMPSCEAGAQQVFASIITAPPGPKPEELLERIQQPLLVLWGEKDPWTPITGAKIYQERVKENLRTQFYSIPNAGHCPHDEKPEQVNGLILDWLSGLNAA